MSVKIKLKKPIRRKIFESGGIDYEEAKRISQERVNSASAEELANSLGNDGMFAIGEDEASFKTEMLDYVNWNGELVDIKGMIDFGKRCWDDLCDGPLGIFTEVFKGRPIIWSVCRDRNNPNALTTACTNGKYMAMDVLFMNQIANKAVEDWQKFGKAKGEKSYTDRAKNYLQYIMLHECMHTFFYHFERELIKGCDNHTLANVAQDAEINGLIEMNYEQFRSLTDTTIGGIFDRDVLGIKWEEVYDIYLNNMPDKVKQYMNQMQGGGGQGGQQQQGQNGNQNGQNGNQGGDPGSDNGGGDGNSDFNDPDFQAGWMEEYEKWQRGKRDRNDTSFD